MTLLLLLFLAVASATAVACYVRKFRAEEELEKALAEITRLLQEATEARKSAEDLIRRKTADLDVEAGRVREHYEQESRKLVEGLHSELQASRSELEALKQLASLTHSGAEVNQVLTNALAEAGQLQEEARALLEQARQESLQERKQAQERARDICRQAEAMLAQSTRDAGRIIAEAESRALEIGGDAYTALRDKQMLDQAVQAMHNIIDGYGDRYIIPTHSVLDELAADFSHTAAGEMLKAAREQTRRMVELGEAATCDYAESGRRATAIRFVIDAFNGRVDAILSRARHDNFGTLEQEIKDAFSLVNLNGEAFRNACVLKSYQDARLSELRWAVVVHELRVREREEQRRIQEQIREEEKARRDYEKAVQETLREEEILRKAMEKARAESVTANEQEKARLESQLAELSTKLAEAEARNQRALSMAQQTRSGHVYIISNLGSFGEDVLKIGMTRRLEPDDRVRELGDASVPFSFDVHAMIRSDDAPALERLLHENFDAFRVNKVNYRKEFFRLPIQRLREFVKEKGLEASFTLTAEAREFRETLAYEKMSPEEQRKYHVRDTMQSADLDE